MTRSVRQPRDEREPPTDRDHDTYYQENWSVLDVSGVDNVFVADTVSAEYPEVLRLDFDALGEGSGDLESEGENVQVSAWFPAPEARELQSQLDSTFDGTGRSEADQLLDRCMNFIERAYPHLPESLHDEAQELRDEIHDR